MKRKSFYILMLLLPGLDLFAQQRHELSVKQAVDLAFQNVVELKNAQLDYQIQEAQNKEIFGQALPQVTGNAGANHYLKLPQVLFPQSEEGIYAVLKRENLVGQGTMAPPPMLIPFALQQPWNMSIGATLTQLLFQPDVFVGLQARRTALELSQARLEQARERIKDSAYKRYYAILIAERQLHYINESMVRLRKLYHDDSIMYVNGFAERLDLDKVQVQINNLSSTKAAVENAVQMAYSALKFSIGIPQADIVVLKDDLSTASLKDDVLIDGFTYENRAEIRTLEQAKKMQELDLKRHKLGYIPTVAFTGNYTVNGQGKQFFTSGNTFWINSAFVGLNVSVPIFDGFQRKYKIQQSRLNVQKVENTIDNVKQAIDLEQNITSGNLRTALQSLDVQERNMQLAERVYNATKLKFEQGLGSSFEVLQADTEMQTSQSNYFNALYNAIVAKISYQYSLGRLQ
jgi:outer membrane protein